MAEKNVLVLFPVGRLIGGSLYEPKTTNMKGEPLMIKNGKNKGQPYSDYFIQIAIPKTPGVGHWANEVSQNPRIGAWGLKIWQAAHSFWGEIAGKKSNFAWKITDGDSQEYDQGNPPKRHCDKPNYPGHWVINMSRMQAPKIVNSTGTEHILGVDAVKRGYYVQVAANISSNETPDKMGIYITHEAVSMQFVGEEISSGINAAAVGFGGEQAPVGASAIPVGAFGHNVPGNMAPPPGMSAPPGQMAPPPTFNVPVQQPAPGNMAPPPGNTQIAPNLGFVQNAANLAQPPGQMAPPPAMMAPPPSMPAAPMQPRLLKNGASYDSAIAKGWDDATLAANGYL